MTGRAWGGTRASTGHLSKLLDLYGIPHMLEVYDPRDHISHVDQRVEHNVLPLFSRNVRSDP